MPERSRLKDSILLYEKDETGRFAASRRFFVIRPVKNAGSAAVCYEAYHENSSRGVLKEFCPTALYCPCHYLERDAAGHLTVRAGEENMRPVYEAEKEKFIAPYRSLRRMLREDKNAALASFIPSFEIYYDCDLSGENTGSVYVWTPATALTTFSEICEELRKEPGTEPEKKLVTVLRCIESLTRCVLLLHDAAFLHRDISPSNFGFQKRGKDVLPESVSLFDINALCSQYDPPGELIETPGFTENPGLQPADIMTDLYSIGATLFYALVTTEETRKNKYRYRPEDYSRLRELVNNSALITASEANRHPKLRYLLFKILQGCLAPRGMGLRYSCCELLLQDLEEALFYALPSEIARKNRSGERWVLLDVAAAADKTRQNEDETAIRFHLYRYPLYKALPPGKPTLDVLLLGLGKYGQTFLDCCLQAGQIANIRLRVTVLSDSGADQEICLSDRPELPRFFNVDGSLINDPGAYGDIRFVTASLPLDPGDDADAEKLLRRKCAGNAPDYIFIALGEDALNVRAAAICRSAFGDREEVQIHRLQEEQNTPAGPGTPLVLHEDLRATPEYAETERIAFNTNLLWFRNRSLRYAAIRKEFRKNYNYGASISFALSVKYKLFGAGIDPDLPPDEAARQYAGNSGNRDQLICLEHRRWVTEKICDGWRPIEEPEECASGHTRDSRGKRHLCIRRSDPDHTLADLTARLGYAAVWDEAPLRTLVALDEIERASVALHRAYVSRAEELEQDPTITDDALTALQDAVADDPAAAAAFRRWFAAVSGVRRGDRALFRSYSVYRDALIDAAGALPKDRAQTVLRQIEAFDTRFRPILLRLEYRNFKQDDALLVDELPFILTYREHSGIVVPLFDAAVGRLTAFLKNTAALTALAPEKLTYLCVLPAGATPGALDTALRDAADLAQRKNLRTAIEAAVFPETAGDAAELEQTLKSLSPGIRRIAVFAPGSSLSACRAYVKSRAEHRAFFALEQNDAPAASLLQNAGLYDTLSVFRAEPAAGTLLPVRDCDMLKYAKCAGGVLPSDLPEGILPGTSPAEAPSFYSGFPALWEHFTAQPEAWRGLCETLRAYAMSNDPTTLFFKAALQPEERFSCCLPAAVCGAVQQVLAYLREAGVISPKSRVFLTDAGLCRVILFSDPGLSKNWESLFAHPYRLFDARLSRTTDGIPGVGIARTELTVRGLRLREESRETQTALLQFLAAQGFLYGLRFGSGTVGFSYASRGAKTLFTEENKITEQFVYHTLQRYLTERQAASADDIACRTLHGEACLLLTRGLRLTVLAFASGKKAAAQYDALCALCAEAGENACGLLLAPGFVPERPAARVFAVDPGDPEALRQRVLEAVSGAAE